jgi:dihydroorotate dehydrogenase (fumarate)
VHEDVALGWGGASRVPSLEQWTEEVAKITRAARDYDCVVIASLGWCGSNLTEEDLWTAEAKAMEEAGVAAVELHTGPSPATEPGRFMMMDPDKYLGMPIRAARKGTKLPIFAKIPVDCCDAVGMAYFAQKAGADGVVPVTRWTTISVDIENETMPEWRGPGMGGPWSVPIMNGLLFRMRHADRPITYLFSKEQGAFPEGGKVEIPIVPSGGVRSGADVIQYMLMGGDAAQICVQVILEGVQVAGRIQGEMSDWMDKKGYQTLDDFRGKVRLLQPSEAKDLPQRLAVIDVDKCTGCERCVKACPNEALSLVDGKAEVDSRFCEGCTACTYICPVGAIGMRNL